MPDWSGSGARYLDDLEFQASRHQRERKKDIVDDLLALLRKPEIVASSFDLDSYFADRIELSQERKDQIGRELKTRGDLASQFLQEIDREISYLQFSLERFTGWGVGYNTGVDVKRNHLERQLQQLRTERRAAQLRAFDDIVRLRHELAEAMRDYRAARRLSGPDSS